MSEDEADDEAAGGRSAISLGLGMLTAVVGVLGLSVVGIVPPLNQPAVLGLWLGAIVGLTFVAGGWLRERRPD